MKKTLHNSAKAVSGKGYSFFSLVSFEQKQPVFRPYLLLFMVVSFCSCSAYQLTTLQSSNMTASKEYGGFTLENDSVRITYTIEDIYAPPLTVEIFNKLNEPLVIDWSRSSLVYNGRAMSYAKTEVSFNSQTRGSSFEWTKRYSTQSSRTDGTASLPKEMDFIPPHSSIKSNLLSLPGELIKTIPDTALHPYTLPLNYTGVSSKAQYGRFDATNSPLIMSSYLTLYPHEKEKSKAIIYMGQLYASEIVNTRQSPDGTIYMMEQRGYRYYLKGSRDDLPVSHTQGKTSQVAAQQRPAPARDKPTSITSL